MRRVARPVVFYASQSGQKTLDQGDAGGNPFASALVELLERPRLTVGALQSELVVLTKRKSRGLQVPEQTAVVGAPRWRLRPAPVESRRVALVVVYSSYRGAAPLPGADRDLERVGAALRGAGFDVRAIANPTRGGLRAALEALSRQSQDAEAAIVYLTGHGFQRRGRVYLMPGNYPFAQGATRLAERAIRVSHLGRYLDASTVNIVFFGGCRSTRW